MRILSLVLTVCLVLSSALWVGASDCNDSLYDCPLYANTYAELYDLPVYGATYPSTPDTDWIPGSDVGVAEEAVLASQVLAAPGYLPVK